MGLTGDLRTLSSSLRLQVVILVVRKFLVHQISRLLGIDLFSPAIDSGTIILQPIIESSNHLLVPEVNVFHVKPPFLQLNKRESIRLLIFLCHGFECATNR